jgi:hypothetical protein
MQIKLGLLLFAKKRDNQKTIRNLYKHNLQQTTYFSPSHSA